MRPTQIAFEYDCGRCFILESPAICLLHILQIAGAVDLPGRNIEKLEQRIEHMDDASLGARSRFAAIIRLPAELADQHDDRDIGVQSNTAQGVQTGIESLILDDHGRALATAI